MYLFCRSSHRIAHVPAASDRCQRLQLHSRDPAAVRADVVDAEPAQVLLLPELQAKSSITGPRGREIRLTGIDWGVLALDSLIRFPQSVQI